jgi:alkylhydroperoxidase family enzyme
MSVADRGPAPDEAFYRSVSEWRTSPLYSLRERVAIEYAERMGTDPKGLAADDQFWARAKGAFSDAEIVDLSYCIGTWIANGRVAHVLGWDTVCSIPPEGARPASERTEAA